MAEGLVGMPSFNLMQIADMLGKIGILVVAGIVIMGLVLVIRHFVLFNVKVTLFNDPDGRIIKRDNLRLNFKKKKVDSLKNKEMFYPFPTTDKIYFEGKKMCLMGRVKDNCVSWMTVGTNTEFKPASMDWYDALSYRLQKNSELTAERSWWDKNKDMIVAMAGYAALIVIAILVTQQMGKLIEVNKDMARTAAIAQSQQLGIFAAGMVSTWRQRKERS